MEGHWLTLHRGVAVVTSTHAKYTFILHLTPFHLSLEAQSPEHTYINIPSYNLPIQKRQKKLLITNGRSKEGP